MTPRRPGHFHAVKFYDSSASLIRIAAEFLGEGLASRQRALVIATPSHRKAVIDALRARHFDVVAMEAAGDLVMLDAQAMLASFMVGGRPDASLFQATAARQLDRLGDRPIRVFGEGVDVLWKAGLAEAAIRLEILWNKLTLGRDIKTLCAYSVGNFYQDASLRAIFDQHSRVVSDKGATIHAHPTVRWAGPPASR
jgi:MEDS: MEthanogen/methylotroph, DcmR Sensory domain